MAVAGGVKGSVRMQIVDGQLWERVEPSTIAQDDIEYIISRLESGQYVYVDNYAGLPAKVREHERVRKMLGANA